MATSHDPFMVRRAVAADMPAVIELRGAVAAEGEWIAAEHPIDAAGDLARFTAALDDPARGVFVAVDDGGTVIGNAGVALEPYGVSEFGMLVAAGWRGRGVGTALVDAVVGWSRAHHAHKVGLQVWPHNAAAIALYAKFGFVEEGVLRRHYRRRNGELWDAVIMGLVLDTEAPGRPF
jgi:RimJ/RimL family protein N-acetyltransferase